MSNTEEIRELMADRVAWDAKVQRVVEATRQRTAAAAEDAERHEGTWDRIRTTPEARDLAGCAANAQG
ncbi:hypothetical protein DIPPA_05941 [Diplonema papillatum]|nr:hypothetical protein DIPPA_13429 [Diplonema papillatum]KAJ9445939.1 hypothetical protein DIPPA_05941 [Diplonema papillatum]